MSRDQGVRRRRARVGAALLASALAVACDALPGRPRPRAQPARASADLDFDRLYGGSCRGCHGDAVRPGAAVDLTDPLYLAVVDDAALTGITAGGVPGTSMPAFARAAGGALGDEQIAVVVRGLRARHGRAGATGGAAAPPYAGPLGDATRGGLALARHCAGCHGPDGAGVPRGGSVVYPSYLALASDQGLRTTIIVGRPRLGMPDWRGERGATPMSAADVGDVVAWLAARRARPAAAGGGEDG